MTGPRLTEQLSLAFTAVDDEPSPPTMGEGAEPVVTTEAPERPVVNRSLMEAICERENLERALRRVKANKGGPGVDGMTVDQLPDYLRTHWPQHRAELMSGTYVPSPVKRVEIPKPGGGVRKLGGLCLPGRSEKIREVVCRFGAHVPIRAVWLARAADWAVRRRPGARVIRGTSASSNRTARSAGCVVNWRAPPATGTDGSVAANASRSNSTRRGGPAADRQPPLPRTGRKVAAGIPDGGLAHATVGRAAARARDRSTRPSRRRCRRRVRTAAARLT